MDELKELAERLRIARVTRKLTAKNAAEKAGVHWQFVYDMETGRRLPSIRTLKKMADVYDVPMFWFFLPETAEGIMPSRFIPMV